MARPRATTIQQRFGFRDNDLKKPKHDEIMLWLSSNMEPIAKAIIAPYFDDWTQEEVNAQKIMASETVNREINRCREKLLEDEPHIIVAPLRLGEEVPWWKKQENHAHQEQRKICAHRMEVLQEWRGLQDPPDKQPLKSHLVWEKPIISQGYSTKYIIGFVDLWAEIYVSYLFVQGIKDPKIIPTWRTNRVRKAQIFFEVKSSIPSLGELIRQIRMYQEYSDKTPFYIVCPDLTFKDALLGQGINFVHYPSGKVFE